MFAPYLHRIVACLLTYVAAVCSAAAFAQPAPAPELVDEYVRIIDTLRTRCHIPGLSYAIVYQGKIVASGGIGLAEVESNRPATANTPYEIASLTKPLAATVVLQLSEEGLLHLDSSLYQVYPDYEEFCRSSASSRSGYLRNYCCAPECNNTLRFHLNHTALGRNPGTWFLYNGLLFGLMRKVIEHTTEYSYFANLTQRIFWQANMTRTLVCADDTVTHPDVLRDLALPYKWDTRKRKWVRQPTGRGAPSASAGVISTVLDLAQFDIALDAGNLLNRRTMAEAWLPRINPNGGDTLIYGLGWFVQPNSYTGPDSPRLVWHYGWLLNGYSALYLKAPDEGLTLILLANGEGLAEGFNLINGDVRKSPFAAHFLRIFLPDSLQASRHP
jgi:CubicO group peptidase (beta-lactamase class C family)